MEHMKGLVTRKIGMTSTIAEDGAVMAITLLSAEPNTVTQLKTIQADGYTAIQVGTKETKKESKPQVGHQKKSGILNKIIREFRLSEEPVDIKIGDKLSADLFNVGDIVKVTGISKGKGFAGTIKRHNFKRGRKTHGGRSYRRPGSIGSMYPQKIFKGKKMSGQMGNSRVSVRNLKIALIDTELKVIGVSGAVPGPRRGIVLIEEAKK